LKRLSKIEDSKDQRDTSKALVKAGIADSLAVPSALKYAKVDVSLKKSDTVINRKGIYLKIQLHNSLGEK